MATNAQLITLTLAEIAALNGTQTGSELTSLKVRAVKLGMNTADIDTRLDAIDMSGEDADSRTENAVANSLKSDVLVLTKPNIFNRVFPKGTEICLDPETGNFLPRNMAAMTNSYTYDSDGYEYTPNSIEGSGSAITAQGKVIAILVSDNASGGSTTLSLHYNVYDPLTKTMVDSGRYGTVIVPFNEISNNTRLTNPVKISENKWGFIIYTITDLEGLFMLMEFDELTDTLTFTTGAALSVNPPLIDGYFERADIVTHTDGSIFIFSERSSSLKFYQLNSTTGAVIINGGTITGEAPAAISRSSYGNGFTYATVLSDGNYLFNCNGELKIKSFDGADFVDVSLPGFTGYSTYDFLKIAEDVFARVAWLASGVFNYYVVKYDPATDTLSELHRVVSILIETAPAPASNLYGGSIGIIGNKILMINSGNYGVFSFDPTTFEYQPNSFYVSKRISEIGQLQFKIDSDTGLIHSANYSTNINTSAAFLLSPTYFTAGNLIPNKSPRLLGVLTEESTVTEMNILVTYPCVKAAGLVAGDTYGHLYALSANYGFPLETLATIWERVKPLSADYVIGIGGAISEGQIQVDDWVGSDYAYQSNTAQVTNPSIEAGYGDRINSKVAVSGSSDSTNSRTSFLITCEGFPFYSSDVAHQSDQSALCFSCYNALSVTAMLHTNHLVSATDGYLFINGETA